MSFRHTLFYPRGQCAGGRLNREGEVLVSLLVIRMVGGRGSKRLDHDPKGPTAMGTTKPVRPHTARPRTAPRNGGAGFQLCPPPPRPKRPSNRSAPRYHPPRAPEGGPIPKRSKNEKSTENALRWRAHQSPCPAFNRGGVLRSGPDARLETRDRVRTTTPTSTANPIDRNTGSPLSSAGRFLLKKMRLAQGRKNTRADAKHGPEHAADGGLHDRFDQELQRDVPAFSPPERGGCRSRVCAR